MRVRMLAAIQGTRDGVSWPPKGGEIELPDGEALQMVAAKYCEPADTPPRPPVSPGGVHMKRDQEVY